jgi:hypothetical protein
MLSGFVRIYRDMAGRLCAVEKDGTVHTLTVDKQLPKTAENYGLKFLGRFVVTPEKEAK